MLRLVVGLGNPGSQYEASRHNLGFLAVDALRQTLGLPEYREGFSGEFARGEPTGHSAPVALLKPMTFMNLSGSSVQSAMAFLKVDIRNVIVLHDELDMHFGDVRVKEGGGHGGHNGLRSLIEQGPSSGFVRVRIGIGRPPAEFRGDVADYVLSGFDPVERAVLPELVEKASRAAEAVLRFGVEEAMNRVNARASPRRSGEEQK